MATYKRALLEEKGGHFKIQETPMIQVPPQGALLKVICAGVCHSDCHIWLDRSTVYPLVMGHEICAEVVEIGSERVKETSIKPGDRVVVFSFPSCKKCEPCQKGAETLCADKRLNAYGIYVDGGYQEYMVVFDDRHLLVVPDNIPSDMASIATCSGLTAYNGVTALKPIVDDMVDKLGRGTVLIVGAGGLGLWAVQIARQIFDKRCKIIVADREESKLETAKAAGAEYTVLWDDNCSEAEGVSRVTSHHGLVHGCVDFVNNQGTIGKVIELMHQGGCYALVGMFALQSMVKTVLAIRKELTIRGRYVGSRGQIRELLQLISDGKIKSPPISHIGLDKVEESLKLLSEGKVTGRTVIKFA